MTGGDFRLTTGTLFRPGTGWEFHHHHCCAPSKIVEDKFTWFRNSDGLSEMRGVDITNNRHKGLQDVTVMQCLTIVSPHRRMFFSC